MEDMILATDVSRHKDFMAQFEVIYSCGCMHCVFQ